MNIIFNQPIRKYECGKNNWITINDCGKIYINNNENIEFKDENNNSIYIRIILKNENDLSTKLNKEIFDRFFHIIIKSIKKHKNIELRNFGAFKVKKMPLRIGTNPRDQSKIYIPEKFKLTFKCILISKLTIKLI